MIQSKVYSLSAGDFNVRSAGKKSNPLLIFLHGFPEAAFSWDFYLKYFSEKGFFCLAPDQRGYNQSCKPEDIKNYTIDKLSKDVVELAEKAGQKEFFLVGHDWGAAVAWDTAIRYPELVKKLLILNVPHPKVAKDTILSDFSQMLKSWYMFFFQLPLLPEALMRFKDSAVQWKLMAESANPGTFTEANRKDYTSFWQSEGCARGMINWYRAMLQYPQNYETLTVKPETLILWGKNDKFLGFNMAKNSLKHCVNAKLIPYDDATHWIHHEHPERTASEILKFVNGALEK